MKVTDMVGEGAAAWLWAWARAWRVWLTVVLLISSSACASAKTLGDLLAELGYTKVAVKNPGNHWFVDVKINGKARRALIDTGATRSAVDDNIAGSLPRSGEVTLMGAKELKRDLVNIGVLEFGGLFFSNLTVAVIEMKEPGQGRVRTGTRLTLGSQRDVILGGDMLRRAHVILNLGDRSLHVRADPPTSAQTNLLARTLAASGMINSPVRDVNSREWIVQGKVNGHSIAVLIDTGAEATKLDASSAQRCEVTGERQKIFSAGVENIKSKGVVSKVRQLELFECRFLNFPVGVSDLRPWGLGPDCGRADCIEGLVAFDVLGRAGALFDCYAGRAWVIPTTVHE